MIRALILIKREISGRDESRPYDHRLISHALIFRSAVL